MPTRQSGRSAHIVVSGSGLAVSGRPIDAELMRLKTARDMSSSLREMAEWCVEIEEMMGGRPPTRRYSTALRPGGGA
jgi:hypothetical protein